MKYFIVFFDRVEAVDYRGLHSRFTGDERIKRWWHYIKSGYIVGTDMTVGELSSHYRRCAELEGIPVNHLAIKVDLRVRQGMLPGNAWAWIRSSNPNIKDG